MLTGKDMRNARVSYDEARDIERMDRDATNLIGFGVGCILGAVLICVASTWVYIEDVAPTATEVSAPGFDLEAKVAEVQP